MDEDEKLVWVMAYGAALIARDPGPNFKADSAVLSFRASNERFGGEYPPEAHEYPTEDVPF